jgi:hypothetical protein
VTGTKTEPPPSAPALTPEQMWGAAGRILGQTALLGALLLFFGWARTRATYDHFGVDLSQLELSTTDYILRSVNTAYDPLLRLGLLAFAGIALHEYLARRSRQAPAIRQAIGIAGLILLAIGGSALLLAPWSQLIGRHVPNDPAIAFAWLPVTLASAFALLAYASWTAPSLADSRLISILLVGLFVLALFWAVSLFANYDGRKRAEAIEQGLPRATEVVLLSEQSLAIGGHGVVSGTLKAGKYRHSYAGLRLLVRAGGKYFLVPSHWQHGRDRVFAIPDGSDIRVEMIAGR